MRSFDDTFKVGSKVTVDRGRRQFAPPPSDTINALALAAGVSETQAIPAGAKFVVFSGTSDFYVKMGDSNVVAAVPADVTNGSGSELNPTSRAIPTGVTHIACIAPATCVVTMSYYG